MNLNEAMLRLMRIGPTECMREDERAIGFSPILPGERDWFPAADWSAGDVVSVNGREVRIVAIKARHMHAGAFSRMITGIAKAGLIPVIVEPMFEMPDILRRWGWSSQITGTGFGREASWRPTKEWLAKRATLTSAIGGGAP